MRPQPECDCPMLRLALHFLLNLISARPIPQREPDLAKAKSLIKAALFFVSLFMTFRAGTTSVPATAPLMVNETATRASLTERELIVSLAVENNTLAPLPVEYTVDLLDPEDRLVAEAARSATVAPGSGVIPLTMTLPELKTDQKHGLHTQDLLWYRLRYHLRPASGSVVRNRSEGVLSVGHVLENAFNLEVAAWQTEPNLHRGFEVLVRATHPFSRAPVAGVELSGSAEFEDSDTKMAAAAKAQTDRDGYAKLLFNVPPQEEDRKAGISVAGRKGGYSAEAEEELEPQRAPRILITTDKPLYQPGQVMHARVLIFGPSGRALSGAQVVLKVQDPDNALVFRSELTTSRFGVAHVDWDIPDHQRLGDYSVRVQIGREGESGNTAYASIRIRRYELPQFTVSIKPDHSYYLPGQNASVEVSGEYLFGQPVKHGRVKVVREEDRRWNYKEQKWEVKESAKYEGEADDQGRFTTQIDLKDAHRDLRGNGYSRFEDLGYAAYITDPITGRTEQRRFDLRVTKEPIHVYLIHWGNHTSWNLPLEFYVSTSYADGTPAECDVAVRIAHKSDDDKDETIALAKVSPAVTVHTNHYGVGKVTGVGAPQTDGNDHSIWLGLQARDAQDREGQQREQIWVDREVVELRVKTDKALYRAGDPIEIQIDSSYPETTLLVNMASDAGVVESRQVEIHQSHASLEIPYRSVFQGEVDVMAWVLPSPGQDRYQQGEAGVRKIIYPARHGLTLNLQLDGDTHRPGEGAQADFGVSGPDGRPVEADLGTMIFDKAVEERARTDREFGGHYGFYYRSYSDESSIGGLKREDLDLLDLSKPLPDGLDLAAEVTLFQSWAEYSPRFFDNSPQSPDLHKLFGKFIDPSLKPLKNAVDERYRRTREYPNDDASLRRFLTETGIDFKAIRDPWGRPYMPKFSTKEAWDTLDVYSVGPDKKPDTEDDFLVLELHWAYFRTSGETLERAFAQYHKRTGGYIRDLPTLRQETARLGLDIGSLLDPWGKPYRFTFGVNGTALTCAVGSGGPNRQFEKERWWRNDDFTVWSISTNYFAATRARIDNALQTYGASTGLFPRDELSFMSALHRSAIDWANLRDSWNHGYYLKFEAENRYSDQVQIQKANSGKGRSQKRDKITPVTLKMINIALRSAGPDGQRGTKDDFDVAHYERAVSEQSGSQLKPVRSASIVLAKGKGAIRGIVTDASGAVVAGVTIHATLQSRSVTVSVETGSDGRYLLRNLEPGNYDISFGHIGFVTGSETDVPVLADQVTELDITLAVGGATHKITVTAEVTSFNTESSSLAGITAIRGGPSPPPPPPPPHERFIESLSRRDSKAGSGTPRPREYFPETLLWEPELITDANGRAQLKFKLADNITTWKISAIGSTVEGEVGTAEKELRAFQPFFVQLDPPPILTQGDEIALPVTARNYLDKSQSIDFEMKPGDWFTLLGPAHRHAEIAAGDSAKQVFSFRAAKSVTDGKQRVTAIGSESSDAIERKVSVHPDGQEITTTVNRMLGEATSLSLNVPPGAIAESAEARLKIYPNLMAHIIDAIEGMLQRPYGCGEQIISSAYPSLLLLRYHKLAGHSDAALETRARRYLQLGYERLLSYQASGGGFSYWGSGDEPDIALSAYALRFLSDTSDFIKVDPEVVQAARSWLMGQQRKDASWPGHRWVIEGREDTRRAALLTASIARVLASLPSDTGSEAAKSGASHGNPPKLAGEASRPNQPPADPVASALTYLRPRVEAIDEPYLIASYTLAALAAHRSTEAAQGARRLQALARREQSGVYWALETNTPFYGWGEAGRVETTALAVEALLQGLKPVSQSAADQSLIDQGLLLLLAQKDRYGVWYSTQATVNVLQTLTLLATENATVSKETPSAAAAMEAAITVNGREAGSIRLAAPGELANPVEVDVSRFLVQGQNRIEIRRPHSSGEASVELVGTHYEPWRASNQGQFVAATGESSGLQMSVRFSKAEAQSGDEIVCHVASERVGFRGYGMMIAEIGLPPGAEVDRGSLDTAQKNWSINRYEVLPDRVVFYLWPQAGGTRFDFSFRPRLAEKARSASSVLYDYYNPSARVVVAPTTFLIR